MRRDWEVTEVVMTSEDRLGGEVVGEVTSEDKLGGDRGCGRGDQRID